MNSENNPLNHVIEFLKNTDQLKEGSNLLQCFKKYASSLEQYDDLGRLFLEMKDYQNSLQCTLKALDLASNPQQQYACRSNLAKLYNHVNDPQKSIFYSEENLKVNPNDYEARMEILFSNYLASNFTESRKILEALLEDPNTPQNVRDRCRFNQGSYLLDDGNFKDGLKGFIGVGHEIGIWPKYNLPIPEWKGDTQPGKTVAVIAEGGIGDEVINVRFMKNITDKGMNPVFITSRLDTRQLFERNGFKTLPSLEGLPKDCVGVKAMYLPIVLDLDKDELWNGPYITPNPEYVEKWKKILPSGKKVAIRWQGNPYYDQDLHRSLPLNELHRLLNLDRDDVTFVSVQKDNDEGIEDYSRVVIVKDHLETLEDLVACLSLMDYNISSCTSVAHIAAACGFPITVCPPVATYYTWLGDSKWYGSNCRVLRQRKWKDWSHLESLKEIV